MKLWKNYNCDEFCDNKKELVTAFQALSDMLPLTRGKYVVEISCSVEMSTKSFITSRPGHQPSQIKAAVCWITYRLFMQTTETYRTVQMTGAQAILCIVLPGTGAQ